MAGTLSARGYLRLSLIAVAAGAICTVASAWLPAWFLGFPNRWENFNGSVFDDSARGYQIICYVSRQEAIGGVRYAAGLARVNRDRPQKDRVQLPSWVRFSPPEPEPPKDLLGYVEMAEARGW